MKLAALLNPLRGTGRDEPRPHLLTVSPLRAAQEGVRSFRLMLELLLHAQVPVPR